MTVETKLKRMEKAAVFSIKHSVLMGTFFERFRQTENGRNWSILFGSVRSLVLGSGITLAALRTKGKILC